MHLRECQERLSGMCSFAGRAVLVVSDVPKHALELAQCSRDEGALSVNVVHASQRKGEAWIFETLLSFPKDPVGEVVLFRWTRDAASCLSCMGAVRSAGLVGKVWFSGQLRLFGGGAGGSSSGKMKGLKDASELAGFSQLHTVHLLTDHDSERTLCFR
jgi:hypothetical protein